MLGIKVANCLVCEDVRREVDGAATLVGVNPIIRCQKREGYFVSRLCFYSELDLSSGCPSSFYLRGKLKSSSYIAFQIEVELNSDFVSDAKKEKVRVITVQGFENLEIEKLGNFSLQISLDESKWQNLRGFTIVA